MTTFRFNVTADDLTPDTALVARVLSSNLAPVLRSMGDEFVNISRMMFTNPSIRPTQWPALSKRYAKKVGRTNATLRKTGALYNSFTVEVTGQSAVVETALPYSAAHFYGYPENNLPPRPYVPVVNDVVTEYASQRITKAGEDTLKTLLMER